MYHLNISECTGDDEEIVSAGNNTRKEVPWTVEVSPCCCIEWLEGTIRQGFERSFVLRFRVEEVVPSFVE